MSEWKEIITTRKSSLAVGLARSISSTNCMQQRIEKSQQAIGGLSKSLVLVGYHEIFQNKKPQITADKRRFVIAYLRSSVFICGFLDSNTKRFYTYSVGQILSQALLQSEKPIAKQAVSQFETNIGQQDVAQLVQIPQIQNITKNLPYDFGSSLPGIEEIEAELRDFLKNHTERRVHREKLHRSVLSVYSVVEKPGSNSLFQEKLKSLGIGEGL